MSPSIERLAITVGEATYALAPTEQVDEVKHAIERQVRAGGGFVDLTADDGQRLSILVTPSSCVTLSSRTVHLEAGTADGYEDAAWDPGAAATFDGDAPYDII